MHVQFALFADAANVSQEGKLNILGVFDALHVGQLPAMHPRATFVVRLKAVAEDVAKEGMCISIPIRNNAKPLISSLTLSENWV